MLPAVSRRFFPSLVWLRRYSKTVTAQTITWKQLTLSSVIPSSRKKRKRVQALFTEKPPAHLESSAADCFLGRQTSRRTMTFFVSLVEEGKKGRRKRRRKKGDGSENWRGWRQELMRCSQWANEPLTETKTRWLCDLESRCVTWNICKGRNDYYQTHICRSRTL